MPHVGMEESAVVRSTQKGTTDRAGPCVVIVVQDAISDAVLAHFFDWPSSQELAKFQADVKQLGHSCRATLIGCAPTHGYKVDIKEALERRIRCCDELKKMSIDVVATHWNDSPKVNVDVVLSGGVIQWRVV